MQTGQTEPVETTRESSAKKVLVLSNHIADFTDEILARMNNKLSPITKPEEVEPGTDKKEEPQAMPPLFEELHASLTRTRFMLRMIDNCLDRVDL